MKLQRLITAFVIALCSFSAKADLFYYSYTFSIGSIVSGSFTGDLNGQYVDNISNVGASLNGTPLTGSPNLFANHWDPIQSTWTNIGPPVVSFDANLNNFLFADVSDPNDPNWTNWFYMMTAGNGHQTEFYVSTPYTYHWMDVDVSGTFDAARWQLIDITPAVPEPASLGLLSLGLAGLGLARRRKQKAA